MQSGEILNNSWELFWEELSDSKKEYINSKLGFKDNLYCTFINWATRVLLNKVFYCHSIQEVDGETVDIEEKTAAEALIIILGNECGIIVKNSIAEDVVSYIKENKGE